MGKFKGSTAREKSKPLQLHPTDFFVGGERPPARHEARGRSVNGRSRAPYPLITDFSLNTSSSRVVRREITEISESSLLLHSLDEQPIISSFHFFL
jgi:hypothetical protein